MLRRGNSVWLLVCSARAFAHDPITTNLTWTREISRIVYQRCANCHHSGGRAFPLVSYDDVRPWAKGIRDEVLSRRMPPWDAVRGVGDFRDDNSLSLPEMDLIVNWVEGGAPEGDPSYLPPQPRNSTAAAERAPANGKEFRGETVLSASLMLAGIRPSGRVEITAQLPGGEVRRLLWVRNFRPEWNRIYWLRVPQKLPAGTRILITGEAVQFF